jgi:hypothetical protein
VLVRQRVIPCTQLIFERAGVYSRSSWLKFVKLVFAPVSHQSSIIRGNANLSYVARYELRPLDPHEKFARSPFFVDTNLRNKHPTNGYLVCGEELKACAGGRCLEHLIRHYEPQVGCVESANENDRQQLACIEQNNGLILQRYCRRTSRRYVGALKNSWMHGSTRRRTSTNSTASPENQPCCKYGQYSRLQ